MNLIQRIKNMLTTPKTEWLVVAAEQPETNTIIFSFIVPLLLVDAVAAFIGFGIIGYGGLGLRLAGFSFGIFYAIRTLVIGIISLYITAYVVDRLAPSFSSEKNFGRSLQLVAYSSTPWLVAGILSILPILSWLAMLAGSIYAIYLWYLGLGPVKKTPEDKAVGYMVVSFLVLIVAYAVIGYILALIFMPIFGLSYGYRFF